MNDYDVVIVGGGVAGCSTALALRRRGAASVALLHTPVPESIRTGETLQPQARRWLEALGVGRDVPRVPSLSAQGVCSAWGGDTLAYDDHLFGLHGKGFLLDRAAFDRYLMDQARSAGVEVIDTSFRAQRLEGEGPWRIRTGEGAGIGGRFLVDATGRRATVARGLGIPRIRFDDLQAVYTLWRGQPEAFPRHTLIESVENGWCYAMALPDDRFVVAVFSDKALVRGLALGRLDRFLEFVGRTAHVGPLLRGAPECLGSRIAAADSSVLETAGSERGWLAAGDAASAYDPLSSAGIAKAMEDGVRAADAIFDWLGGASGAIDAYCKRIQVAFEHYLKQRAYYYGLERRWRRSTFWASRQEWIGLHPDCVVCSRRESESRLPDRILSSGELGRIRAVCGHGGLRAHEVVRQYQGQSPRRYPDWRVIQAIGFLVATGHVAAHGPCGHGTFQRHAVPAPVGSPSMR